MITLKNTLLLNAVSSGVTGLGLIAAAEPIADLFGATSATPIIGTGIFLVLFAGLVFIAHRKNPLDGKLVQWIILLDTLWVVSSIAILVLQPLMWSGIAYVAIAAVAAWVAAMAFLQYKGLRQLSL